jgi:hypothetical protein
MSLLVFLWKIQLFAFPPSAGNQTDEAEGQQRQGRGFRDLTDQQIAIRIEFTGFKRKKCEPLQAVRSSHPRRRPCKERLGQRGKSGRNFCTNTKERVYIESSKRPRYWRDASSTQCRSF